MTAMRMAQTTERSMPNNRITSMDPSSYQTATPEQLQAAGIPPIVINDRVPDRRVMMQRQLSQPLDDRFHSNGYVSSRSPVYANQQNGLSVYHQQLLGTRIPPVRTVEVIFYLYLSHP